MADKESPDDLLVATESFATEIDGDPQIVHVGKTRVRRGHPLHLAKPEAWELVDNNPTVVETAERRPGEKRGAPATGV